jgi:hypothetical protein
MKERVKNIMAEIGKLNARGASALGTKRHLPYEVSRNEISPKQRSEEIDLFLGYTRPNFSYRTLRDWCMMADTLSI